MPIINFNKEFVDLIESDKKRQTIRKPRKIPIKVGDILYLYTGFGSENSRQIGTFECKSVEGIVIIRDKVHNIVMINKIRLSQREIIMLAISDGFKHEYDFFSFFISKNVHEFSGDLIKW